MLNSTNFGFPIAFDKLSDGNVKQPAKAPKQNIFNILLIILIESLFNHKSKIKSLANYLQTNDN